MIRLYHSKEKLSTVKIIIGKGELTKGRENSTQIYFHV